MKITRCKINHLTNPLGYLLRSLTFSWCVEEAAGKFQTSARIVVKRDNEVVADTGWAELDSLATNVDLNLQPRTRYTWTVSVKSDAGEEAESEVNYFETAKMEEPWEAKWIGCNDEETRHPIFCKNIVPEKEVAKARLYICGLGLYEVLWNGEKIGNEILAPYCNNYHTWLQYQTYDVSSQLQDAGILMVTLGNGWYKGRFGYDDHKGEPYYGNSWKLIAELHLTYADGSFEIIGTDESWQVGRSNIIFSNIYDGEQRDDTLPAVRSDVAKIADVPSGILTARYSLPVTIQEELAVKEVIHTPAGEIVLDMGQNLAGIFRLRVHEPEGAKIHLQFGEILQNGNFYRDNLRTAKAEYCYTSDGAEHILQPKFTYYGYRYVKVEGIRDLKPEDFTALVLYSEIPRSGWLSTGNELVNHLISNTEWGQKGNFIDVPTDCPQRDERMGWTGDAQVFGGTACFQRDSYSFFAKYLHDLETEQIMKNGKVPNVIPSFGKDECSAAWGDVACILPWTLYEYYGDPAILEQQYKSMTGWVDYITEINGDDNGWGKQFHFGDWLALDADKADNLRGGTDVGLIAITQYYHSTLLTAKAARILDRDEEAERYEALAQHILSEIREEYFSPRGRCCVPTQTGYLLALRHGLAPDSNRVAADLVAKLKENDGMLQTGFVGTPLICPELTRAGYVDMAFELLLNEQYPGWLYAVRLGATTIWERWNSVLPDGTIAENGMNSLNHYSYGSIVEWIYRDVAGLAPEKPGFRKAVLRPHYHAALGKAEVRYQSAAGMWHTKWEILENGDVSYQCEVPFGCTAILELPYGGGTYELQPGEFSMTYTPDQPLHAIFSTSMPIGELLQNARIKAVLLKMIPQLGQLPPSMQGLSMRTLAGQIGGGSMKPEMLDQLDDVLAKL